MGLVQRHGWRKPLGADLTKLPLEVASTGATPMLGSRFGPVRDSRGATSLSIAFYVETRRGGEPQRPQKPVERKGNS